MWQLGTNDESVPLRQCMKHSRKPLVEPPSDSLQARKAECIKCLEKSLKEMWQLKFTLAKKEIKTI